MQKWLIQKLDFFKFLFESGTQHKSLYDKRLSFLNSLFFLVSENHKISMFTSGRIFSNVHLPAHCEAVQWCWCIYTGGSIFVQLVYLLQTPTVFYFLVSVYLHQHRSEILVLVLEFKTPKWRREMTVTSWRFAWLK